MEAALARSLLATEQLLPVKFRAVILSDLRRGGTVAAIGAWAPVQLARPAAKVQGIALELFGPPA